MAENGTVIRVTSGGGAGRRKEKCLIVIHGNFSGKTANEMARAAGKSRQYRIRKYPLTHEKVGAVVPYRDLGVKNGKYWEAEFEGYSPNPVPKQMTASELEQRLLEQEVKKYPNLPASIRWNAILGLQFFIRHVEESWRLSSVHNEYAGDAKESFREYISSYVEKNVTAKSAPEDAVAAAQAYNSIRAVLEGNVDATFEAGTSRKSAWDALASARQGLELRVSIGIPKCSFARLKVWADYQQRLKRGTSK